MGPSVSKSTIQGRPKHRPYLTRNDFVAAALRIMAQHGAQGITVRALGIELGVDPTAIYRHFKNKDSLIIAVLESLSAQNNEQDIASLAPAERLRAIALTTRAALIRHHDLAMALVNVTEGTGAPSPLSQLTISALRELGYEGRELVICYQAMESTWIGASIFDGGGSPSNWKIRRERYLGWGIQAFTDEADSDACVEAIAETAFAHSVRQLVDAISNHRFMTQPRKP